MSGKMNLQEISEPENKHIITPKPAPKIKKVPVGPITITEDEKEKLKRKAKEKGLSVSSLIRTTLKELGYI